MFTIYNGYCKADQSFINLTKEGDLYGNERGFIQCKGMGFGSW